MAKKIVDEDMVLNVIINGDKGRKELNDLERAVKDLSIANEKLAIEKAKVEREMKKLETSGKKDTDAYRTMEVEVRRLSATMDKNQQASTQAQSRMDTLRNGIDLTKKTVSDLRSEMTRLTKLRNTATPGTEQWKAYNAELQRVALRLDELKEESANTKGALCRMADGVNKYWNLVVSGLASLTGIFLSVNAAVQKFVAFDDILSDTQKTTGLTKKEVDELNNSLKNIDTRTSQEELQGLARIGGKLGVEGKENLEGFVNAANQINVALKEDLGGDTEEAINQVGKLVDIFNVSDNFGIEQGMLKVGSVINELGAASTANEGYIVEFSKRVAGVAPSAGVSVAATMGLAATLDQLGQHAEASSTVYSQMMSKMFKNTATYAKIAGMNVSEFSTLMNTDANEAFIRVLEGLKGNNAGMETLVTNLGEMELGGVRATTVLGTLANNTTTLREQQLIANEAFRTGISLTDEYSIKNNNVAAELEKQQKIRTQLIIDLGQKLHPIIVSGNSLMNTGLKILKELIVFMLKYGTTIVQISSLIAAYTIGLRMNAFWTKNVTDALKAKNIAQRLDVIWSKSQLAATNLLSAGKALLTGNIKAATASFKAFSVAVKLNPIGLLLTAVTAVGIGIYKLATYMTDTEKAQKRLNDSIKESQSAALSEQRELAKLKGELDAATKGTAEYNNIKNKIIDRYGKYDENLKNEIEKVGLLDGTYQRLTESIQKSFGARQYEKFKQGESDNLDQILSDNLGKIQDRLLNELGDELGTKYYSTIRNALLKGEDLSAEIVTVLDKVQDKGTIMADARLDGYVRNIQKAQKNFEEIDKKAQVKFGIEKKSEIDTPVSPVLNEIDTEKHSTSQLKTPDFDTQIIALKEKYAKQIITKKEYEQQLDSLELSQMQYRLKNFEGDGQKRIELQQKIADKQITIRERQDKEEEKKDKEEKKNQEDKSKDYVETLLSENETLSQKETLANIERLRKAGLYGKDKEQLTVDQLKAIEILEKQHQDNLLKIEEDYRKKENDAYMKGITDRIKNMEIAHRMENGQRKSEYYDVLDKTDSPRQKRQLTVDFNKDMGGLAEKQAGEMADLLNELLVQMDIDSDVDLGEIVLSPEQKEQVMTRLNEVKEQLASLKDVSDYAKVENYGVDILGMDAGQWDVLFEHLEDGKLGIEDMQMAIAGVSAAWSTYDKLKTAQEKKQLKQYEQKTKKEKAALDKQLDAGQISQEQYNARTSQLDADLDAKKEAIEQKQAERSKRMAIFQTVMNLAAGLVQLWVKPGFPAAIPMAAVLGALGAIQIATISAAQYADGKYPVIGDKDGRTYQADYTGENLQTGIYQRPTLGLFSEKTPEMVVDGATTRKLVFDYPQIYQSIMDVSYGRTPQFAAGRYPASIPESTQNYKTSLSSDLEIKRLVEANLAVMKELRDKRFEIPWYGRGGLDEKMKKAEKYERSTMITK